MQIFTPFFFLGSDKFFLNITSDQVTLELVAPDSKTCDYWQDAYHFLTNIKPTSGQMKENLELFLQFEVQLMLLDLEEVDLPDEPPMIPPPPPMFDLQIRD